MKRAILTLVLLVLADSAQAQTRPSASEISGYDGLHRAAYEGDVAAIRRLAEAGADLDARDRAGRTPAHVAAFASHDAALRALAEAGADMNALENGIYDVLTIAAVADDADLVSLALELGNRADLVTSIYDGTALIAAAHLGHAIWRRPSWMEHPHGPDVPPDFPWLPVVTFLQLSVDMVTAVAPSIGHGHTYAFAYYVDAWAALTDAPGWTADDLECLKCEMSGNL